MYVKFRDGLGKKLNIIQPGEYYATGEDELIGTLLGSCVAVCLHDDVNRIGAMNHYMLPGRLSKSSWGDGDSTKYGIASINIIMKEMLRLGASRAGLTAKIFGGGNILKSIASMKKKTMIPADNVRVARLMMEMEDIPITAMDVGADYTRKIIFDVHSGKVYLRKFKGDDISELVLSRDGMLLE